MKKYENFNITSAFIFPLLEIPKDLFLCNVKNIFGKTLLTNRFINCYLGDIQITKQYNYEKGFVYLLINNYQDSDYQTFFDTLQSFPSYFDNYERLGCTIFIFKIPDTNFYDYQLLLEGKYSEVSPDAKKLIMKNHFFIGESYNIPLILNKALALKNSWEFIIGDSIGEQDVWSKVLPEKESITDDILNHFNKSKTKSIKPIGEY